MAARMAARPLTLAKESIQSCETVPSSIIYIHIYIYIYGATMIAAFLQGQNHSAAVCLINEPILAPTDPWFDSRKDS